MQGPGTADLAWDSSSSFLQVMKLLQTGRKAVLGTTLDLWGSRVGGWSSDSQEHRLSWDVMWSFRVGVTGKEHSVSFLLRLQCVLLSLPLSCAFR